MLFTKLKLNYFGKFRNYEIELKPGINLIYGTNEAGKSTIHSFIKGMLFGIDRMRGRGSASKEDLYTRYLPWDYPGAFNGNLDLQIGEKEYRLQRSFHAGDKYFTIIDLTTGREVKLKDGVIGELIPGLTEAAFRNTVSIEQLKAQTEVELSMQVRNYIANMSATKSTDFDVAKAVSRLTEQRKILEASKNLIDLKALQVEIEDSLKKEEQLELLTLELRELQKAEKSLRHMNEEFSNSLDKEDLSRMEQYPAIEEKYATYLEMARQKQRLENQSRDLQTKVTMWEKEQHTLGSLKEDITEAQKLNLKRPELERQQKELHAERKTLQRQAIKKLCFSILPSGILGTIILLLMGVKLPGLIAASVVYLSGIIGYLFLRRNIINRRGLLEERETSLEKDMSELQFKLDSIISRYRVVHAEELIGKQEELLKSHYALEHTKEQLKDVKKREDALEDQIDATYDTIMKYLQYFTPAEELSDGTMKMLREEINGRRQTGVEKQSEINREIGECILRMEKVKWEISSLEGNEELLLRNQARYKEQLRKHQELELELQAVKLALSTMAELSADIHDSFGTCLNQAVSSVISEITNQKYTDLKIDEKLGVKVGYNGDYVLLERLSAGTMEQIYFALRLTIADLLFGKDEVPLLFDDSFALYDDSRVRATLRKLAERKQVMIFTCHKRENIILEEFGLPYHYVDLTSR